MGIIVADRPVYPDDVGAHIRQHHRAERTWPDTGEFDDPHAGERPLPRRLLDAMRSHRTRVVLHARRSIRTHVSNNPITRPVTLTNTRHQNSPQPPFSD